MEESRTHSAIGHELALVEEGSHACTMKFIVK
jgi:hypothetical protein